MTTGYEEYIRQAARARGIDPDIAVRVARSEGGTKGFIQSNVTKNGAREPSYGPFQLLVGGQGTGFPEGMGNQMLRETGLDPRDPANAQAGIDFALGQAKNVGWGQWYGAKGQGITGKMGINGASAPLVSTPRTSQGDPINVASGGAAPALPAPYTVGDRPIATPAMGSMSPGQQQAVPDSVMASAQEPTATDKMGSMFSAMMMQPQQAPQMQPVQFNGPSPQQANALSSFIAALRQRMA